jgi:large subunit ribosomal protein L28
MSRVCEICNKQTVAGRSIVRRGVAKYKGGIGLNTTGISKRTFKPNIQRVRVIVNGGVRRMRVCTKCIRAGRIKKAS